MPGNKVCFLTGNIKLTFSDFVKIAGVAAAGTTIGYVAAKAIWSRMTKNRRKELEDIIEEVLSRH